MSETNSMSDLSAEKVVAELETALLAARMGKDGVLLPKPKYHEIFIAALSHGLDLIAQQAARLEEVTRERDEARANLNASRNLVDRRTRERDQHAERADDNYEHYRGMIRERDDVQAALTAAEAEVGRLASALATISYHYDNQDLSHLDFRVKAAECARACLSSKKEG